MSSALFRFTEINQFLDEKTNTPYFQCSCIVDGQEFPHGDVEKQKKKAEHAASRKALDILLSDSRPIPQTGKSPVINYHLMRVMH